MMALCILLINNLYLEMYYVWQMIPPNYINQETNYLNLTHLVCVPKIIWSNQWPEMCRDYSQPSSQDTDTARQDKDGMSTP